MERAKCKTFIRYFYRQFSHGFILLIKNRLFTNEILKTVICDSDKTLTRLLPITILTCKQLDLQYCFAALKLL